jgi:hypothetical protein
MSGTHITMQFSAVIESWDRIPPSALVQANPDQMADEAVRGMLEAVMHEAGQRFIDEHPELFRPGTGLV